MKVTMLLADHAQAAEGKLNIIGAGWTLVGPGPAPFAIAILFEVPWDRANEQHRFRLELVDSDGEPVLTETSAGEEPLVIEGQFEVGRPPGVKRGTPLPFPLAINMGPQPIAPGGRYEWRLTVDQESDEDWRLAFSTRPDEGAA
ncbi:MAG TPA: hypothetical protein VN740_05560 [Solirubrobacteraceae bacterium]|nr:hypothetical protein [Solirubrobacteraceae bacterium]